MNSRTVAVKPFLDALVRYWDTFSADWDALETVRWLLFGFRCLLDALRLMGPKTPRERVHRVRGVASTGVPTATALASSSPPDWI